MHPRVLFLMFMYEASPKEEPHPQIAACCQLHLLHAVSAPDRVDVIHCDTVMPLLLCQSEC